MGSRSTMGINLRNKVKVLFRADGSHLLGMGHIMRCLALAQHFKKLGIHSLFVVKNYENRIAELIISYGFDVEKLSVEASFSEDASHTLEIVKNKGIKVLLTDLSNSETMKDYKLYARYFKILKDAGIFLITMDGLDGDSVSKRIKIASDIVVIPYFGAEYSNYKFSPCTKPLLGPSYFIFRQELVEAIRRKTRYDKKEFENIFITMGGSDPFDLSIKVLSALSDNNLLNIKVAVGMAFSSKTVIRLKAIIRKTSANGCELAMMSPSATAENMANSLLWADIVITAGGLTKYESVLLGKPTIIISQNERAGKSSDIFAEETGAIHLGSRDKVSDARIITVLNEILENNALRLEMAEKGKKILDGKGAERIIGKIPKELFV